MIMHKIQFLKFLLSYWVSLVDCTLVDCKFTLKKKRKKNAAIYSYCDINKTELKLYQYIKIKIEDIGILSEIYLTLITKVPVKIH